MKIKICINKYIYIYYFNIIKYNYLFCNGKRDKVKIQIFRNIKVDLK